MSIRDPERLKQVLSDPRRLAKAFSRHTYGMLVWVDLFGGKLKSIKDPEVKLVAAGIIPNLEPTAVVPFVKTMLQFRIIGSDDSEVKPNRVAGLFVGVSSSQVTLPMSDLELPHWGPTTERITMWSKD